LSTKLAQSRHLRLVAQKSDRQGMSRAENGVSFDVISTNSIPFPWNAWVATCLRAVWTIKILWQSLVWLEYLRRSGPI
jgi:hypothetical protein